MSAPLHYTIEQATNGLLRVAARFHGSWEGAAALTALQAIGQLEELLMASAVAIESYLDEDEAALNRDGAIADIVRDVAELPDRDSPEGQPEMMLVTTEELTEILHRHITDYEALEREHLGDPDKRTGIYHPDNCSPLRRAAAGALIVAEIERVDRANG